MPSRPSDARKIAQARKDAVVTVQVVVEADVSYEGRSEKEQRKVSAAATIIDPSGLAVTALSEIDPTPTPDQSGDDAGPGFSFTTNVVDARIKTEDGGEIPADVVLRDRDLDLAFIKPRKPAAPPTSYIDLSETASPQLLDELVVLSRLGPEAGRSLSACLDRVEAVVTKPRAFYVVSQSACRGCPAFTLDGKVAGIVVARISPYTERGMDSAMDNTPDLSIVLPCSTVSKAAMQAKQAKPGNAPASAGTVRHAPRKNEGK